MGRQYGLRVDGEEFLLDLLFYNHPLRRFFVFELKIGKFAPAALGQLTFYVNAVDAYLRDPEHDRETIGILLVANKNETVVDLTLRTMSAPLAVSAFDPGQMPPEISGYMEDLAIALRTT